MTDAGQDADRRLRAREAYKFREEQWHSTAAGVLCTKVRTLDDMPMLDSAERQIYQLYAVRATSASHIRRKSVSAHSARERQIIRQYMGPSHWNYEHTLPRAITHDAYTGARSSQAGISTAQGCPFDQIQMPDYAERQIYQLYAVRANPDCHIRRKSVGAYSDRERQSIEHYMGPFHWHYDIALCDATTNSQGNWAELRQRGAAIRPIKMLATNTIYELLQGVARRLHTDNFSLVYDHIETMTGRKRTITLSWFNLQYYIHSGAAFFKDDYAPRLGVIPGVHSISHEAVGDHKEF